MLFCGQRRRAGTLVRFLDGATDQAAARWSRRPYAPVGGGLVPAAYGGVGREPLVAVNLSHFDLNLLRALDALLEERSVTRAGARLFVTQQAASSALHRLRVHFGDELLTRAGRRLELTPLAVSLARPVREALLAAQAALDTRPSFDPAAARRTYRVVMSDYSSMVLLQRVLGRLTRQAPGIRCFVEPLARDSFERLDAGTLDFVVTAHEPRLYGDHYRAAGLRSSRLFHDDFVCVVDAAVELSHGLLTLAQYGAMEHSSVAFGQGIATLVERAWVACELDVRPLVTVPSFSSLIMAVPGTRLVATAQRRLARLLAPSLGLRIVECPLRVPLLQENLFWHERNHLDPASHFLRGLFEEASAELDDEVAQAERAAVTPPGLPEADQPSFPGSAVPVP